MSARQIRQARKHPAKRAHIDLPLADLQEAWGECDDGADPNDHDGYSPIRERDQLPMREGPPLDLREPWSFPR